MITQISCLWTFSDYFWLLLTNFIPFGFNFGILLGCFSDISSMSYFGLVFYSFVLEKCKESKAEDVAPDLYITVFCNGHMI